MPNVLFKKIASEISLPLSCILNASMSLFSIHSDWAMVIVVHVFKNGYTSDINNYRQISLICISCKIMESVIKDTMLCHLLKNKLITKHQHAFFLSRHSTTAQLIERVGDWTLKLSNKQQFDVAELDFTKAFDSVVHSKLSHKLKCYRFNGLLLDLIKCFLINRRQMVRMGSSLSHSCNVISGVPQGSVLGPVLVIIYINDICRIACSVKDDVTYNLFADVVKVYTCIIYVESAIMLQRCLDLICNWATSWQLNLPLVNALCCLLERRMLIPCTTAVILCCLW